MIRDLFIYGLKNMRHRQLRSWLTVLGVVIGIAAIVSLMTIGQGLENAIVEQFSAMGAGKIRVVPEGLTGPPVGESGFTEDDVDIVKDTIGIDYAGGVILTSAQITYDNQNYITFIKAIDSELAEEAKPDINAEIGDGHWFSSGETKVAVIGYNFANNLFDKEIMLKNNIEINGIKFKIVGILEKIGTQEIDNVLYISKDDAREIFDNEESVNFIYAAVEEGKDLEEVAIKVQTNLERSRGNDNFDVYTPEQLLSQLGSILSIVQFILAGIAAISLAVGGIGIMNTMYTSVLERTKEIGAMKAIGASQKHILIIFIFESGLIGLVGGLIGAILGTFFAFSVSGIASLLGFDYLKITILWSVILFALLFAFILGMVSGLWPAYKASKLNPVEALRYE
ncbi:ABC transporter permease [Candidatus Woesearchaeota archaeon]|nr:ABC transporter permease [Candidatus Woesearchaeota archaeon]